MISAHILLRRLFTSRPSASELNFHWWFITEGQPVWWLYLAKEGIEVKRRMGIIRAQEKLSFKVVETWDTARLNSYREGSTGCVEIYTPGEVTHFLQPTTHN
jgi:hypothetical protein